MKNVRNIFTGLGLRNPNIIQDFPTRKLMERIDNAMAKIDLRYHCVVPSPEAEAFVSSVFSATGCPQGYETERKVACYLDATYSQSAGKSARFHDRGNHEPWLEVMNAFASGLGVRVSTPAQRRAGLDADVAALRCELDNFRNNLPARMAQATRAAIFDTVLRQVTLEQFMAMTPDDMDRACAAVLQGKPVLAHSGRREVPASDERSIGGAALRGIDEAKFELDVVVSPPTVDRHGTIFLPSAWENGLAEYRRNPVVLFAHAQRSPDPGVVIGRAEKVWIDPRLGLLARIRFAVEENPTAKRVWDMVRGGFLQAISHGFSHQKAVQLGDPEVDELPAFAQAALRNDQAWAVYTAVSLREISVVTVPSNPDAVVLREAA